MEASDAPPGFYGALLQDTNDLARSPAGGDNKPEFESALVQTLQRQVAKLRNDLKTSNTQLSNVRQQKTKANDELKVIDQKYEKKIKHLELLVTAEKQKAEQNLQLAKKIQNWNDEQAKQCTALVNSNEKITDEKFELQLQIEAMDCLMKGITPEKIQGEPAMVHPFSWYTRVMAAWRVNLAKVEGKCKAFEEMASKKEKAYNKDMSALMLKGERERQEMMDRVFIGLCQVSGMEDQETVDRLAQEQGPGSKSKEVRAKIAKLLEHILVEAASKSTSGADPLEMYDALRKEVKGLPEANMLATPAHRLLAATRQSAQPSTKPNTGNRAASKNIPKGVPKPAAIIAKEAANAATPTSSVPAVSVTGSKNASYPSVRTKDFTTPETKSPTPPTPLKDPSQSKTYVFKVESAVPRATSATMNSMNNIPTSATTPTPTIPRVESKVRAAGPAPSQVDIQKLLLDKKKAEFGLNQVIKDITEIRRKLHDTMAVHCTDHPAECTHMPAQPIDETKTPCTRWDCIRRMTENRDMKGKMEEMEEYINLIAPMAAIGSSVRIQYLEECRAALEGDEPDAAVVREGTIAARGANGDIDNNLFAGEDDIDDHPLFQMFEKIYDAKPRASWEDLPELLKKTINCKATIRFAKNLPACDAMMVLLHGHKLLCDRLIKRFYKYVEGDTELYEANVNHWLLLDRLEWLTDEILMFDEDKSLRTFLDFLDTDNNNPKVRVKRWPGAEEEFGGSGFGYLCTVRERVTDHDKQQHDLLLARIREDNQAEEATRAARWEARAKPSK